MNGCDLPLMKSYKC